MREAVAFLIKDPFLGRMQTLGALMGAVVFPISALVFPAWFIFAHQDSQALGIFLGAGAIGGMIGGALFAAVGQKFKQRTWLIGALIGYALAPLCLYFLQPGSLLPVVVSFVAGSMMSILFTVPMSAFYSRTPQKLLGRAGSVGAAMGYLTAALASLGLGWLIHTVSAPTALLACAAIMGLLAIAFATMPFVRLLDNRPEAVKAASESTPTASQA